MQTAITTFDTYSLASITANDVEFVLARISVDLHGENSLKSAAAQALYSDILLSGAGNLSRAEFLAAVNALGAEINLSVTDGRVTIDLKAAATKFAALMKLVTLMLTEPQFKAAELRRARRSTANDLHQERENSKIVAHEELTNVLYGTNDRRSHPEYDALIDAVKSGSVSELKRLHRRFFSRTWTATVVGPQRAVKTFATHLKDLKSGTVLTPSDVIHQPKTPLGELSLTDIPSRQNIDFSLGLGLPFTLEHPDFVPLSFGVAVLGKWGGFAGRLMSTVREKEGLTYGIYSKLEGFQLDEHGYLRIMTFFARQQSVQGLSSTWREFTNLVEHGITTTEFAAFQTILSTQQTMLRDSYQRQLLDLHSYHCHGFSLEAIKEHKARLHELSREEVNTAITDYLDPARLTISGAGPVSDVRSDLQKWFMSVT